MTSFQRRYFGDIEQPDSERQEQEVAGSTPGGETPYTYQSQHTPSAPDPSVGQAEPPHVTGYASVARDAARAAPNYYIKAYRPWSASNKPESEAKQHTKRPYSAAVSRPSHPLPEREIHSDRDVITSSVTSRIEPSLLEQLEETNNRWASFSKTSATPISADYGGETMEKPLPEPSKPTVIVAKPTPPAPAKIVVPSAFADSAPLPAPSAHAKVTFTSDASQPEGNEKSDESARTKDVKSILRKTSKYERRPRSGYSPYPSYQSAAVARQQWVNHITGTPYLKAKLNGTEVKDSMEVQRADDERGSPKSVRWHEVKKSFMFNALNSMVF